MVDEFADELLEGILPHGHHHERPWGSLAGQRQSVPSQGACCGDGLRGNVPEGGGRESVHGGALGAEFKGIHIQRDRRAARQQEEEEGIKHPAKAALGRFVTVKISRAVGRYGSRYIITRRRTLCTAVGAPSAVRATMCSTKYVLSRVARVCCATVYPC